MCVWNVMLVSVWRDAWINREQTPGMQGGSCLDRLVQGLLALPESREQDMELRDNWEVENRQRAP